MPTMPDRSTDRESIFNAILFMEAICTTPTQLSTFLLLQQTVGAMRARDLITEGALAFTEAERTLVAQHPELGWEATANDFETTIWACATAALDAATTGTWDMDVAMRIWQAVSTCFTQQTGIVFPPRGDAPSAPPTT